MRENENEIRRALRRLREQGKISREDYEAKCQQLGAVLSSTPQRRLTDFIAAAELVPAGTFPTYQPLTPEETAQLVALFEKATGGAKFELPGTQTAAGWLCEFHMAAAPHVRRMAEMTQNMSNEARASFIYEPNPGK